MAEEAGLEPASNGFQRPAFYQLNYSSLMETIMPYKDKDKQRAAWRRWYYENKEQAINYKLEAKKKNREFIKRYKKFCGCQVCGEKEPACLDAHHPNNDKKATVSQLIPWGRTAVKRELRKCIILCSNCHRKLHAGILQV